MSFAYQFSFYPLINALVNGVLVTTLWEKIFAVLLLTHATIICVTVYLHRCQSHRALDVHPLVAHLFRFWLWLTTGMRTKDWVAIHRKHHACVETADDPHSPQVFGLSKVLWQGAELYRTAAQDSAMLARYGVGTPDDWLERNVYSRHPALGIGVMFAIDLVLFGLYGISVWALQMLWIPFLAAGVVNGIGHFKGYRNFESNDASTNICPWGLLIGGEELHNNHHAFPTSAKLSSRWWEVDAGWMYISLLLCLRLARVNKLAAKPRIQHSKSGADLDTVNAVIRNHMHVMAHFASSVVTPVHQEERKRTRDPELRGLLKRTQHLLMQSEARLDPQSRKHLQHGLASSQSLQVVYHFKQRLQALWQDHSMSGDAALLALTEWCHHADATNIEALREFARVLRCYTLHKV